VDQQAGVRRVRTVHRPPQVLLSGRRRPISLQPFSHVIRSFASHIEIQLLQLFTFRANCSKLWFLHFL
jgi:hypothetical protein